MPEEKIIAGVGTISSEKDLTGTVNGTAEAYTGTVEATSADKDDLSGISSLSGSVGTLMDDESFNGTLSAQNKMGGAASATMTLRLGQDGQDGEDGFSPVISVYKDTSTEYILQVTNKDGSYLTPNLYPDLEGLQDVEALVASKVDKDLSDYPEVDPITLNSDQKENSYFYINTYDGKYRKMSLNEVALEKDVADRFRTKIRTVDSRPDDDWRLGDFIFLTDLGQEEGE